MPIARLARVLALASAAAAVAPATVGAYGFDAEQQAHAFAYLSTPIGLRGRIVDEHGDALAGAQVRLIGWGEGLIHTGEETSSTDTGEFELLGLARRNALLEVRLPGHYPELIPVREALAALDSAWNPARAGAVR